MVKQGNAMVKQGSLKTPDWVQSHQGHESLPQQPEARVWREEDLEEGALMFRDILAESFANPKDAFKALDRNRDNGLDKAEFVHAIKKAAKEAQWDVDTTFFMSGLGEFLFESMLDLNSDGVVTFDEFCQAVQRTLCIDPTGKDWSRPPGSRAGSRPGSRPGSAPASPTLSRSSWGSEEPTSEHQSPKESKEPSSKESNGSIYRRRSRRNSASSVSFSLEIDEVLLQEIDDEIDGEMVRNNRRCSTEPADMQRELSTLAENPDSRAPSKAPMRRSATMSPASPRSPFRRSKRGSLENWESEKSEEADQSVGGKGRFGLMRSLTMSTVSTSTGNSG